MVQLKLLYPARSLCDVVYQVTQIFTASRSIVTWQQRGGSAAVVRHAELHVGGLIERHEFGEGRGRGLSKGEKTSDSQRGENVAMERDLVTMRSCQGRPSECYS